MIVALTGGKAMERLSIVRGDITTRTVDAIVNAANSALQGGGGVDGAIHRRAGPELAEAGRRLGGCPTGEARITPGFRLPARWVIHTVGPVWRGGGHGEHELLASCYRACFALAAAHDVRTIAFPSISTGIYRFPLGEAVPIALREIAVGLQQRPELAEVRVICFEEAVYAAYQGELATLKQRSEPVSGDAAQGGTER
jgi:O-acetyl-ADP-ribose deacetylase (regulator of RNase III)